MSPRRSGCGVSSGIGCLLTLAGLAAIAYIGFRLVLIQFEAEASRWEKQGYKRVTGQVIEVNERIREPTVFVARVVKIRRGSDRGIAMLCLNAEIEGTIVGNVRFFGLDLLIRPGAHLQRDLDVKALTVNAYGLIEGNITGVYRTLNTKPPLHVLKGD